MALSLELKGEKSMGRLQSNQILRQLFCYGIVVSISHILNSLYVNAYPKLSIFQDFQWCLASRVMRYNIQVATESVAIWYRR